MNNRRPKVLIMKIGNFLYDLYDNNLQIHLRNMEPRRMADLLDYSGFDVYMYSDQDHHAQNQSFQTYNNIFFIDHTTFDWNTEFDNVILWQGIYMDFEHHTIKGIYERFNNVTAKQKFFLLTDTRLPLAIFPAKYNVPELDISDVTLITQARYADKFVADLSLQKYHDEFAIQHRLEHYKDFRAAVYLPLHLLPVLANNVIQGPKKSFYDMVFMTQGFGLMREDRLNDVIKYFYESSEPRDMDVKLALVGKQRFTDMNAIKSKYPSFITSDTKMLDPVPFNQVHHLLSCCTSQLVLAEDDYRKYGLLPNRIVESIVGGCIPIIDKRILIPEIDNELRYPLSDRLREITEFSDSNPWCVLESAINYRENHNDALRLELNAWRLYLKQLVHIDLIPSIQALLTT